MSNGFNFVASYSNTIAGVLRTLTISAQDDTNHTLSGIWASTINGVPAAFPVSGFYVPAPNNAASNAVFFVLSGATQTFDTKAAPPIMRAIDTLVGYCEPGTGGGQPDPQRLYLTLAWSEDNPGYRKEASAWTGQHLDRH